MMPSRAIVGYSLAILAVSVWAGNFIVARGIQESQSVPPIALAFWRWALAFLIVLPLLAFSKKEDWACVKREWVTVFLCGVLGVVGFASFTYLAAASATATSLSVVSILSPFLTAMFALLLLKERLGARTAVGLFVCAFGVVLVLQSESKLGVGSYLQIGTLWMALAACCWAAYSVLAARKPDLTKRPIFLVSSICVGLVPLSVAYWFEFLAKGGFHVTANIAVSLMYLALCVSVVGYASWNFATREIGAVRTGAIYFLMPAFTAMGASFFLGESISLAQAAGIFAIIFGNWMLSARTNISSGA